MKKILIVEDDLQNQMIYKILFSEKYFIQICSDGNEFDDAIKKDDFDLFIIDLAIPGNKNGIQIIQELKGMDAYKQAPVLVITAFAFRKDRIAALEAGATEVLIKPVPNNTMVKVVESFFT